MAATLNFWVDIETAAGVKFGPGPIRARNFSLTKVLDESGEFAFEVEAGAANLSALAAKRVAVCRYINAAGQVVTLGGGVVDKIVLVTGEDGALVYQVGGNDIARLLANRTVGKLTLAAGAAGVTDAPERVMAKAPSGWSLDGGTTGTPIYGSLDGETVLNGLVRCAEHIGEHWRVGAGREVVWLGPKTNFAASGLRAVQHVNDPGSLASGIAVIASLEEAEDAGDVVTRVYPRGSGNGDAVVTLSAATQSPPAGYTLDKYNNCLTNDAAVGSYDLIERAIDFKEIGPVSNTTPDVQNAANMLLQASVEYLERRAAAPKFYNLELDGVAQLLEPGTTLRVVYRRVDSGVVLYDLDDTLNIVQVEQAITETGLQTTRVTVSTADRRPETDGEILAAQIQAARVFAAYPQLNANSYVTSYREAMDSGSPAALDFWLGREVVNVHQVALRFRVDPLRSTVKSIGANTVTSDSGGESTQTSSSGGGSSQTSSSGGGGSVTSASGGGATVGGGSHNHKAGPVYNGVGDSYPVYAKVETSELVSLYASGKSGGPHYIEVSVRDSHDHDLPTHTHGVSVPAHTHSVDIPAHDHSVDIPSHTHDVTPEIETVYGLFEEDGANTLAEADLLYAVNGEAISGRATDIGGGWYELDVTGQVTEADTFRPVQATNQITISTATENKTCTITGQLLVRTVIQAVAYL